MLRGLYTAASGMLSTTVANDTLANNLANINTVGFKNKTTNFQSFPEMLLSRMSRQGSTPIGSVMTGSHVHGTVTDFAPGPLMESSNTFDMAIEGNAFFTIKSPTGHLYYTRAGNFTVNEEGYLTTVNGDYVQGQLGNIILSLDEGPFNISTSGQISAKGRVIDSLKITRFNDDNTLENVGNNYFQKSSVTQEMPPPANGVSTGIKIHQYTLEQSNVNPILELVNSIQGMRLYEALQKNIHLHNETLGKTVNEVGRHR